MVLPMMDKETLDDILWGFPELVYATDRDKWLEKFKARIMAAVEFEPKAAPVYEYAVWISGERADLAQVIEDWASKGWQFVTMTYRLMVPLARGYSGEYVCVYRREKKGE